MRISTTVRICAVIVLLSLVAFWLTVGFGVYTNGYQSVRSRYVTCDGRVLKTESTVELCESSPVFKLTGAGFKFASWGNYDVKIVVNPAAKAVYTNGTATAPVEDNADVTEFFQIERDGQTFKIAEGNYNLSTVVKKLYGDSAFLTEGNADVPTYVMTVTDGNEGGKSYSYLLSYTCEPSDLIIDPDKIIAG